MWGKVWGVRGKVKRNVGGCKEVWGEAWESVWGECGKVC